MADQTLNCFLGRGTTAERTAFVPDPPSPAGDPPDLCYLWWDSDDELLYVYNFITGPQWDVVGTAGTVPSARTISTTAPLTGGGDLSANRTFAISDATTSAKGAVELATDGEVAANVVVQGNDARLSNSRTPTTHATSHESGGGDAIKLDNLAAPDDNTDLNVSITAHGLTPKLPNNAAVFLNGVGGYTAPVGTLADAAIEIVIGDGVNLITTGAQFFYGRVPWTFTLTGWKIVAKQSGSIVFDIWKDVFANFPPTVADTVVGAGTKPSLSSAQKAVFANLTSWTTAWAKDDYLEINVDSVSGGLTKVILTLYGTRSS